MARPVSNTPIRSRSPIVAGLDVGTDKVACIIGQVAPGDEALPRHQRRIQSLGTGFQRCNGLRAGTVVDVNATANAIRSAVDQAERLAGTHIDEVYVNVSCGGLKSHSISVEVEVAGHQITDYELARVLREARLAADRKDLYIIHQIATGYSIDGQRGVRDPRNMYGDRLGVALHIVTSQFGPLRNLVSAVQAARLDVAGIVASSYASGLAVLSEDEMNLGVTLIDMGAGTTTVSVFFEGALIFVDTVPVGGRKVTDDLGEFLRRSIEFPEQVTPMATERMKVRNGSAVPGPDDHRRVVEYAAHDDLNGGALYQINASQLPSIIAPRIEETFEMVQRKLKAAGLDRLAGRSLVLTGGASQLVGVDQIAERILDKKVRLARGPVRMVGLADMANGPAFATASGLVAYPLRGPLEAVEHERAADASPASSPMGRIGRWLRQAF